MKKNLWRKVLSALLALTLCLTLPLSVLAEEGFVDVETSAGNKEPVKVDINITPTTQHDGSVQTETAIQGQNQVTESGATVNYQGQSSMNTHPDGTVTGTASSNYTVSNGVYGAEGGSETEIKEQAPNASVDVPLSDKEGENQNTAYGDPAGTVTGEKPVPGEGNYDNTYTEVMEQGSITATTEKVEFTQDTSDMDLEYTHGTVKPDGNNNLIDYGSDLMTQEEIDAAAKEGYTHMYVGSDVFSQYASAFVRTSTKPSYPGEPPVFEKDGVKYYVHDQHYRFENGGFYGDGYYLDGEFISTEEMKEMDPNAEKNAYARWGHVQRFVFVDMETGEMFTTYCADHQTPAKDGYNYIVKNVEDADYYTDENAAKIRAIALSGYWGTESGQGSLDAMKQLLKDSGQFSQAELDALTDGIAMTATQYAIWNFSNEADGVELVNAYFMDNNEDDPRQLADGEKDSVDLLFKVYHYLIGLEGKEAAGTTADTMINKDNFLENLNVTVIGKADHENNNDNDKTNDAYTTNISFALKVTPSGKNGEEMVVELIGNGVNVKGRISGTPQEGEVPLTVDDNGNYTFENIVITEGDQTFSINLSGVQYLDEGVYLYTSEVINGESSQTMVGIASGERSYHVSMDIDFSLSVEDEVVATEHVWRTEWTDPGEGGTFRIRHRDPGDDDLTEIPDEEVPLADAPKTGDGSVILAAISALSGIGYAGLNFTGKKKER